MFETYDELSISIKENKDRLIELKELEINQIIKANKEVIDRIRRAKKNHFYANSGLIKLSTIHSFKGLEAKTVFYIMHEDDDAEMIYTALTRSTENLVILDVGSNNTCSEFLSKAAY